MSQVEQHQHPVLEHPAYVVKKRTIIKDRVGCPRSSTYSLPGDDHTYGKKNEHPDETAGESKF
jgi:hypothetical protein